MKNLKEIDYSRELLLDALAYGCVEEKHVFSKKDEYEIFFNKPWHGLGCLPLFNLIEILLEKKWVERKKINFNEEKQKLSSLAILCLTKLGGLQWEKIYSINWNLYSELIFSDYVDEHLDDYFINGIYSPCKLHLERVLQELKKMMHFHEQSEISINMERGWSWSNWKIHNIYYHAVFPNFGIRTAKEKIELEVVNLVQKINKGWKLEYANLS